MHICQRHILISIEIYCKWAFLPSLLFLTNQTFPDKSKVNLRIKCKVPLVVYFEVVYSRKGRLWMQVVDTFNGDFQTCLNGSLDNSFASLMLCYCFRRMLHTKYFGAAAGGNGRHVCSQSNTFFISLFCDFYSQRCGMAQSRSFCILYCLFGWQQQ